MNKCKTYIAIDLKSFYASVECRERSRDPLTTNLVVADPSRTEKTICLAVSPSLKKYGLSGRARLFEVIQKVNAANNIRKLKAPNHVFSGSSDDNYCGNGMWKSAGEKGESIGCLRKSIQCPG